MIVKTAVDSYLTGIQVESATKRFYRSVLNRFAVSVGLYEPIKQVKHDRVQTFLTTLEPQLGTKTLHSYWKVIRSFFAWMHKIYPECPAPALRWHLEPVDETKAITDEQVAKLIAAAGSLRDELIIRFMADTGMDAVAVSSLKVKDIQGRRVFAWERGYIYPMLIQPDTRGKLDLWLRSHPAWDWLFCERRGNQLSATGVRVMLHRTAKRAGIKNISIEGFYHRKGVRYLEVCLEVSEEEKVEIPVYLR